ncbi:DgyrCDS5517 [Dimorphilus gyrociliatus]|uniref:DgyrCDS5517 n=1 Tax=Dimorphilus gyrociliatus TaxID=2664684 RepID=A0A7I8VK44_9ANNE|nr:DgyrCDS5517 [Dimorphilus gyrociliatus]
MFSTDLQFVLFGYERRQLWRHSFLAKYTIYDRTNQVFIPFPNGQLQNATLQMAVWSRSGQKISFVHDNDLYVQNSPSEDPIRLTTDGKKEKIFNGIADWLYEEEILSTYSAHYWSPSSDRLVYARFNDEDVPLFDFTFYGPKETMYPETVQIAYPKAGNLNESQNTKVELRAVRLNNPTNHVTLKPPSELVGKDHYYTRITWFDNDLLYVVWANRVQNKTFGTFCDSNTGDCQTVDRLVVADGWIDPGQTILFTGEEKTFFTIRANNGYRQILFINPDINQFQYLTDDECDITSLVSYDSTHRKLYYITTNFDPKKRFLFVYDLTRFEKKCLTCDINCGYASASFSGDSSYYLQVCLGPSVPEYKLRKTNDEDFTRILEDNTEFKEKLEKKIVPKKEYLKVPIGGGYDAWAEIMKPPNMTDGTKYPVIVTTYGGPGSQRVTERFSIGWEHYWTTSQNVVHIALDGRGTNNNGTHFMHLLYRKVGTLEVEDQITGAKYFRDTYEFIDGDKMAIWGWSYGGFLTSHTMANSNSAFQCGIIGAALFDRRYYDTAHTERFMGMAGPEDNQDGYERTNVMRKIDLMKDKKFLIIHGTADDNVHFQSSAHMFKALNEKEIQYQTAIYTDLNHYFLRRSRHILRLMTNFFVKDCFEKVPN